MKNYLQFQITNQNSTERDIIIATLSEFGFEGFEETDEGINATTLEGQVNLDEVDAWLHEQGFTFRYSTIPDQNWNALWESNFEPVVVNDFACVRAHFHAPNPQVKYDLLITPKMSFGTGHHATTWQMMEQMQHLPIAGSRVFDFGTGTGVLAILAEKMGAAEVEAIDIDTWSIENAAENITNNECTKIKLHLAEKLDSFAAAYIVLANINKHILLDNASELIALTKPGGFLLLSGLLVDDEKDIQDTFTSIAFEFRNKTEKSGWIALLYRQKETEC
jgi:ribosomal protein L11 methyltransferase